MATQKIILGSDGSLEYNSVLFGVCHRWYLSILLLFYISRIPSTEWASSSLLHYVDDIKLSAKSEREISLPVHTTKIYNNKNIGMSLTVNKCRPMFTMGGRIVITESGSLPDGRVHRYKYLVDLQENGNREKDSRKAATYLQRVRPEESTQCKEHVL